MHIPKYMLIETAQSCHLNQPLRAKLVLPLGTLTVATAFHRHSHLLAIANVGHNISICSSWTWDKNAFQNAEVPILIENKLHFNSRDQMSVDYHTDMTALSIISGSNFNNAS